MATVLSSVVEGGVAGGVAKGGTGEDGGGDEGGLGGVVSIRKCSLEFGLCSGLLAGGYRGANRRQAGTYGLRGREVPVNNPACRSGAN